MSISNNNSQAPINKSGKVVDTIKDITIQTFQMNDD